MQINSNFKKYKLIPLNRYSKIPSKPWATDDELIFKGNETSYGIDTGRSNLVVIDCDNKNDVDGVKNFIDLYIENEGDIPDTLTVETPNNGMHFYFKNDSETPIASSVSKILKGVDVRAKGGYIVGPESEIKTDDGEIKRYNIMSEKDDEDINISVLPNWLFKKLTESNISKPRKTGKVNLQEKEININVKDSITTQDEIEAIYALEWGKNKLHDAQDGERNSILNHVSYFMGVKKVDYEKASSLKKIAIDIGLTEKEVDETFEKSYNKGLKEENTKFENIIKEFNSKTGTSFKDDPIDSEFYSHLSLSYNFWLKYRNELLYWEMDSNWYEYNSEKGIWKIVGEEVIRTLMKIFLEELVTEIRNNKKYKIPANIYKLQEKLWAKSTIEAVASLTKSDFLNRTENLFDSKKDMINIKNGTFSLKEKKMYHHNSSFFITKYIPLNLKLDMTDDYCNKVLESIHPEERNYLQLIAGQALTGHQPNIQASFFLFGYGSNGKTTFIDLMLRTSGTYGKLQTPDILLPTNGKEIYAMADFEGLRMAIIEELPDSKQLNSGSLKRLVGTAKINARAIYGKNREIDNDSTIFVSCNRLPLVNDTDDGTWRRLMVINFPYSYKRNEKDIKNEWDRLGDSMVLLSARKRTSTAEAFLSWRVEGAMSWYDNINAEKNIPKNIQKSVEEWNENNDLFLAWFNECLIKKENSFIILQDAFDSFNNWLLRRGNSKVSLRYFISSFTTHKTFHNNNLLYKKKQYISKGMLRSIYYDENNNYKKTEVHENIFMNVSFS